MVQLQLVILRAYIRKFRDSKEIDSNLPKLAHALKVFRHSTKGVDEDELKARFTLIGREFGEMKYSGEFDLDENGVTSDNDARWDER